MFVTTLLVALLVAVGLAGIVVPVLPGTLLLAAAFVFWGAVVGSTTGWVVVGIALAWLLAGAVVKFAVPGKRLKDAGVPNSTLLLGGLVGIVGFFVVPVVGFFAGFVLGVYAAEQRRLGRSGAWPSTVKALKAVGLSILIELATALAATLTWVVGIFLV